MKLVIVDDKTPQRCCARCGATPADVRKMGWRCSHYGVYYDHHIWIWWQPAESSATAPE